MPLLNAFLVLLLVADLMQPYLTKPLLTLGGMNIYPIDCARAVGCCLVLTRIHRYVPLLKLQGSVRAFAALLALMALDCAFGLRMGNELKHVLRDFSEQLVYASAFLMFFAVRHRSLAVRWLTVLVTVGVAGSVFSLIMRFVGIQATTGFEGSAEVETHFGTVSRAYGLAGAVPFYLVSALLCRCCSRCEKSCPSVRSSHWAPAA
jgi:hypothetical protein